jgi:hypothetical protein
MTTKQKSILQFLARNRYATFKDIHAFIAGDETTLRRDLRLFKGDAVAYIKICDQDAAERNLRTHIRYELDNKGLVYLKQNGLADVALERPHISNFTHAVLASHGTGSIEAGVAAASNATLLLWPEIKATKSMPPKTASAANPFGIPYADKDGEIHRAYADSPPFGIKLALEDRSKFRLFPGIEADNGSKAKQKIIDQFEAYLAIEREREYVSHFGFPDGSFFVPFLVKSIHQTDRVEWMKDILEEMTEGKGSKTMMFMRYQPEGAPGYLFNEAWERVGYGPVTLAK